MSAGPADRAALRELGRDLISLEDARAEILSLVTALPAEDVALEGAFGRVLREDVVAPQPAEFRPPDL